MAIAGILNNAFFSINAVDLSDHVKSLQFPTSADVKEITAMGATTKINVGGLKDWSITVELYQDFSASKVDATIAPIVGSSVAVEIRPTTAVASPTNPKWTGTAVVESYNPVSGGVGDVLMATVSLKPASALTRATA